MNDEQIEECWLEAEREADAPESEWLLYGKKVAAKAQAEMQELLLAPTLRSCERCHARIAELEQALSDAGARINTLAANERRLIDEMIALRAAIEKATKP